MIKCDNLTAYLDNCDGFQVLAAPSATHRRVTLSYEYTLPTATMKMKLNTLSFPGVRVDHVVKPSDNDGLDDIKRNESVSLESMYLASFIYTLCALRSVSLESTYFASFTYTLCALRSVSLESTYLASFTYIICALRSVSLESTYLASFTYTLCALRSVSLESTYLASFTYTLCALRSVSLESTYLA